MQIEQASEDLLILDTDHVRATTGKRFANYLIDLVLFYVIIFVLAMLLFALAPSSVEMFEDGSTGFGLLDQLIFLVLYAVYMSFIETLFKGKSLGKLITKTRAVNLDGSRMSASKAFARGFSRAVPFCVFSAFGHPCNPWQDKWTNTMVVDERRSDIL